MENLQADPLLDSSSFPSSVCPGKKKKTGTGNAYVIFTIPFLIQYVYYLGQSVLQNLVNQLNSFEDVAFNVDTNKSQNLELLRDTADFA